MSRTQISLPVILRGLATWTAANIATPKFTVENTTVPSVQCLASLLLVKAAVRGNQQVTLDVKLFCVVLKQSRMKTSMANDRHISKPSEPEPSTQYTTWALYRARLWGQKADTARQGWATAGTRATSSGGGLPFLPLLSLKENEFPPTPPSSFWDKHPGQVRPFPTPTNLQLLLKRIFKEQLTDSFVPAPMSFSQSCNVMLLHSQLYLKSCWD